MLNYNGKLEFSLVTVQLIQTAEYGVDVIVCTADPILIYL